MKITLITQKLDPQDYVFGFFYGHIIDLANKCEEVHVVCLEHAHSFELPANVHVHSLGKEDGVSRLEYIRRLFSFLFSHIGKYDIVLVHMEPLYVLLCGWWWRLTGVNIVLWYNHVFKNLPLRLAAPLAHEIISASPQGVPVPHRRIRYISYEKDITALLTEG